jgi:transposase-like protein
MALSRRKFTKEVKVAAIQRLDAGASVAEVARAFEVNPNLLHRWRKEFRHGPGNAFPGGGKRRWDDDQGLYRFQPSFKVRSLVGGQGPRIPVRGVPPSMA